MIGIGLSIHYTTNKNYYLDGLYINSLLLITIVISEITWFLGLNIDK